MNHERLITGVAATLGTLALVLAAVGVTGSPLALPVAIAFGASAVLMYDQLSGRMAERVYEHVERRARVNGANAGGAGSSGAGTTRRQRTRRRRASRRAGGVGAGPREEWTPPRGGATIGEAAARNRGAAGRGQGATGRGRAAGSQRTTAGGRMRSDDTMSAAAAYRTLDLEPGADQAAIKAAYREKVMEVHPDTADGDEETFMAVKEAYERLSD